MPTSRIHIKQPVIFALIACICSFNLVAQTRVEIGIIGVESRLEENVRLFLSIEQQKNHALISEGRVRRLHKKAVNEITSALQPFGYYRSRVNASLEKSSAGIWQARYVIDPGPALPIGEFNFSISKEMSNDPEFQHLLKNIMLMKGQIFNHLEYERFKTELIKLAGDRGYFDAHFSTHRVEIDLDAYEARIELNYEGGPRYRFGKIQLDQDIIDPELLQRYIPFEPGSYYTQRKMIDLQQGLNDSDYFRTVEISPGKRTAGSDEIPVSIELTPNKRHRFSFGLGYGTDTGARTKFGWQIPRVNPQGHRFDVETKLSQLGSSLITHYRVPVLNPRTDQITYSAGEVNEETDASSSTVRTLGASLNRGLGLWRESVSLNYQREDFTVAGVQAHSTLLLPSVNWSRTWGNNFIDTIDGLRFEIGLRGASQQLISSASFLQLQGSIKAITSITTRDRFISRGNLATTATLDFDDLPSSVRYFTGGGQSVRGFAYQSLGPVNAQGKTIGGKHLMIGSIEFEHSFSDRWGMAVFADAGNAINDFEDELERSAGFGFRWKSPVGPIRIDFASVLTRQDRPWRIHFNIGPDL